MQVRALKTFHGRMGLIRSGEVVTVEDRYGKQLVNNKLVAVHVPGENKPDTNKNLGDAPKQKGDEGGEGDGGGKAPDESSQNQGDGKAGDTSAGQQAGGAMKPVSSPRAARRSRKKT